MEPLSIDQSPLGVFERFLHDMCAAFSLSIGGLELQRKQLESGLADSERLGNENPVIYFGQGDPNVAFNPYGAVTIRMAIAGSVRGGRYSVILSQAWASSVYAAWEHHFRTTISEAIGCPRDELSSDAMGDLRLVRHDIEHELGIATSANSGRCLKLHWAEIGELIVIGPSRIEEFMRLMEVEIAAWRSQMNSVEGNTKRWSVSPL